jgi:hypothetical protein
MKTLPKVATEMALHVFAYNLTRVMNVVDQTTARGGPGVRSVYCCARRGTVQVAQRNPRLRSD